MESKTKPIKEKKKSFDGPVGPMKHLDGFFTMEEMNIILDKSSLPKDRPPKEREVTNAERDWLLFYMLANTGRRISELLEIRPRDITIYDNTITWHILKKKNKNERRRIAVHPSVIDTVWHYITLWEIGLDDYIFQSTIIPDRPFTRRWAGKHIYEMCKRAGFAVKGKKDAHPHMLRHSYTINILTHTSHPAALKLVQDQLAHSSLNVTSHYMQFSPKEHKKMLKEVYERQNDDD